MGDSKHRANDLDTDLVIGWRLASDLETEQWDKCGERRLGAVLPHMVECLPAGSIASHTVVVAQSGSGKSYFLQRYVEEVAIKTKANIVIIDPNGDFRRIGETNAALWNNVDADNCFKSHIKTNGFPKPPLSHESDRTVFDKQWSAIGKHVMGQSSGAANAAGIAHSQFYLPRITADLILIGSRKDKELEDKARRQVSKLHAFVGECILAVASIGKTIDRVDANWLISIFTSLKNTGSRTPSGDPDRQFERLVDDLNSHLAAKVKSGDAVAVEAIASLRKAAVAAIEVGALAQREFYIDRLESLTARNRVARSLQEESSSIGSGSHIRVLDLPSFGDRDDRDMCVLFLLESVWQEAREKWQEAATKEFDDRVPTLIVLDEAHNLAPASDADLTDVQTRIRNLVKTIAGEGRKYGLYLVVVTQRPDKVDQQVLSECGNQAIMMMKSEAVLKHCRESLGVEMSADEIYAIRTSFQKGHVRLSGGWSPNGPRMTYSMAPRTRPGGTNLRDSHWAKPRAAPVEQTQPRQHLPEQIAPAQASGSVVETKPATAAKTTVN